MDVVDLIYGRILFVTGKGGVGKSSVTAALGRLAAAQGRRTLVVEIDCPNPAMNSIFGQEAVHEPKEVAPNLWICNLDWLKTMDDWVRKVVPAGRVVSLVLNNEIVQTFLRVAPGNRETSVLSKLNWMLEDFDLLVVDMPASGHAAGLLEVPATMLKLFESGPIYEEGVKAATMLGNRGAHLVLVGLPEEMVVNETLQTHRRIRGSVPQLDASVVVLNRSATPSLTDAEREFLADLSSEFTEGEAGELLWAGRWEDALEQATQEALVRLAELDVTVVTTPRLSQEGGPDPVVQQLAAALARRSKKGEAP